MDDGVTPDPDIVRAFEARLNLGGILRGDDAHGQGQAAELEEPICAGPVRVHEQRRFVGDGAEEMVEARVELSACDGDTADCFEEGVTFPCGAVFEGHAWGWYGVGGIGGGGF
ncbi:hypothetical protein TNCT6_64270 [Streptomyces sp. 6-11-2]|nr:hypothetical protein TNCT6_64270 [Streptomyces sp. 6-11-2]